MIPHEYWRTWASGLPDTLISLMTVHDQPGQGTINTPIDTRAQLIARQAYQGQFFRLCLETYGHVPLQQTIDRVWADLINKEYCPEVDPTRERVQNARVENGDTLACDLPSDPNVWIPMVFLWDYVRFHEVGVLDNNPTPGEGIYIIVHQFYNGDKYGLPSQFLTIS